MLPAREDGSSRLLGSRWDRRPAPRCQEAPPCGSDWVADRYRRAPVDCCRSPSRTTVPDAPGTWPARADRSGVRSPALCAATGPHAATSTHMASASPQRSGRVRFRSIAITNTRISLWIQDGGRQNPVAGIGGLTLSVRSGVQKPRRRFRPPQHFRLYDPCQSSSVFPVWCHARVIPATSSPQASWVLSCSPAVARMRSRRVRSR